MSYNPYGVSGSIIIPPHKVRTSKAWRRQYPRKAYFTDLVVRDKAGNIIVAVEDSVAVKLARRTIKNAKPKPDTTPKPLSNDELRRIALDERKAMMASLWAKPAPQYN